MNFKQFLIENNSIARTNALKKQQELIDAGRKNIEVTKLPGGVYHITIGHESRSWFCTSDGRIEELTRRTKLDITKLLTDLDTAYRYARDVLQGPFPAGEPAIATNAYYSFLYAHNVLKGPFPAGEPAIATSAECAFYYAKHVLNGPFPAGEKSIMSSEHKAEYEEFLASLKP